MKTLKITMAACAIIIAGTIFYSCQKEETFTPAKAEMNMLKASYDDADCNVSCIDPLDPEYFEMTDYATDNAGPNIKKVTYVAYNTLDDFVVKVTYEIIAGSSNAHSNITVSFGAAVPQVFADVAKGTTVTATFPLSTGWEACDGVTFSITETSIADPITWTDVSYNLFGECSDCDLEGNSLTGQIISGCGYHREVVYIFSSEEGVDYFKMQGGLTANFIDEEPDVTVADGYSVSIKETGNGNFVISVSGALAECSTVVVTITWNSENADTEITGEWTVKDADGNELAPGLSPLECE